MAFDHKFVVNTIGEQTAKPLKITMCSVCGGTPRKSIGNGASIEKSLTRDCPGVALTTDQVSRVADGKLDFRAGEWIELN